MTGSPDYYKILSVSPTATQQQIRDAYKRAALKSHPDRVPADSPEREARTKKFQQINDAYYTLSDPRRRREYDDARRYNFTEDESEPETPEEDIPRPGGGTAGGFPWSSFGFGGGRGGASAGPQASDRASEQFGSVFEEMLREEGLAEDEDDGTGGQRARPTNRFWSILGGLSGAGLGFIVANFAGAVAGAVAGNRLGAIRDAKGKSVYEVFLELPQEGRARLLSELAARVLQSAVG